MYKLTFVAVVLMLSLAGSAAPAQHAGAMRKTLAGDWQVTFSIAGQTASGTLSFQKVKGKWAGTVDTAHTGHGTLQDLRWSHNQLTTTCVFEKHESIALDGELKDGKLSGTFHTEGMDGTWEAMPAEASAATSPAAGSGS